MSWLACYSAPSAPDAHLVMGFLEQRGVPCVLESAGPSLYPSIAMGHRMRILVPEEWFPVASKLVEHGRRGSRGR
jgi:hypothetical protein